MLHSCICVLCDSLGNTGSGGVGMGEFPLQKLINSVGKSSTSLAVCWQHDINPVFDPQQIIAAEMQIIAAGMQTQAILQLCKDFKTVASSCSFAKSTKKIVHPK